MNPILAHLQKNAGKRHKNVEKIILAMDDRINIPEDLDEIFDNEYQGLDGNILYADIYRPKGREISALPIAVFAHGGGLFVGNRRINRIFFEILARIGYLVFSIDYRLLNEADAIGEISDVCAGLCYVNRCAGEYGGDLDKVFLFGESAGAFLMLYASVVANTDLFNNIIEMPDRLPRIKGIVCISGMIYTTKNDVIGMVYKNDLYGKRRHDKEFMKLMNPSTGEIISSLPSVFLVSSSGDFLKKYTLEFAKKLEKAGHKYELVYFENADHLKHAFVSFMPLVPESSQTLAKVKGWTEQLSQNKGG